MPEWPNGTDSKSVVLAIAPRVQIPIFPPYRTSKPLKFLEFRGLFRFRLTTCRKSVENVLESMAGQRYVVNAVAAMVQCSVASQSHSAGAVLYRVMWTADSFLVSEGPQAMASISKLRKSAFIQQNGQCYYCGCPMWTDSPESFAKRRNLSVKQARHLRCTAEHLKARQDGGKDVAGNIAAACIYCNQHRHHRKKPMDPEQYQRHVKARIERGGWHCISM